MHFVLLFLAFMMGWSLVAQAAVNRNLAEHAGGAPLWASMLSAFVSAACLLLFQVAVRSKWPGRGTIQWDTLVGLDRRVAGRIQRASTRAPGRPLGDRAPLCGHHHRAADLLVARRSPRGARPPTPPCHPSPAVRDGLAVCRRLPRSALGAVHK